MPQTSLELALAQTPVSGDIVFSRCLVDRQEVEKKNHAGTDRNQSTVQFPI